MIRSTLRMTKQTPIAARGMVVAEHPIGAEVGASILARGGNAVDAAVATAFAMPVVEPFMSTIAGGGSFLIHMAKRGETIAIDANVEAPASAHEHCYELGEGVSDDLFPWRRVVGDANVFGPRAVAIPGSVAGLCLALQRYGTMALADVVAPAIRLAEEGFIPDWYVAQTISLYTRELRAFPETARTYLRDGQDIYRPPGGHDGDLLRQPDLGRSLRLIAKDGPDAFYRGAIAQAIHDEVQGKGGFLTREDLAGYEARVLSPLTGGYRGLELAFMPGATGGITSLEILNLLAEFSSSEVTYRTVGGLHLRAEAVRLAFLDRLRLLGDALRVTAPWDGLASRLRPRPRPPDQALPRQRDRPRPLEIRRDPLGSSKRECPPWGESGGRNECPRWGESGGHIEAPADGKSHACRDHQRLHHPHRLHRPPPEHGLVHEHRRLALRSADGGSGHGHPAAKRHDLVRP